MSDPTRERIVATFDRELASTPLPPGLRERTIHAAVTAPRTSPREPRLLALVAAVVALAVIATLVLTHQQASPVPAVKPSGPPPPRTDAAVTYDAARGQLVVFGGSTGGRQLGDTWTWDGKNWRHERPPVSPSARMSAASAYDQVHHVVVLFGGRPTGGPQIVDLSDTWTWNGQTWTQQHPAHSPKLSYDSPATMGFDPASRSLLLFGFAKVTTGSSTNMTPQTWSWSGSDWTQLNPPAMPQSIGDMFSDGRHLFLTAPPAGVSGAGSHFQMSEWDGRSWVGVASQNVIPPYGSGIMSAAFDVQRDELVVLNGDTWTWSQSRWRRQHPTQQPPTGYMMYFPPLHEVISFGERWGESSNAVSGWNGADWIVLTPSTVPPQPTPAGRFGPSTPAAAETFIRQTVKSSSPVLLPAWLPAGMEASGLATADYFDVTYLNDQRDKSIEVLLGAGSPPPGDANSSDTYVKFRNALALKYQRPGYAEYFVYDPSNPVGNRFLTWIEPGTMSVGGSTSSGVWYLVGASGLTDQEFWQVANSLR